jgi:uncharacterized protein
MAADDPTLGDRTIVALDAAECRARLASRPVGRIVFLDGDQPVALPVNHALHDDGVVFKTVAGGTLDEVSRAGRPVGFEVDEFDDASRAGWSVLVKGTPQPVGDAAEVAELERLELYSWLPDLSRRRWAPETPAWEPVRAYTWVRVPIREITGRRTLPA